MARKNYSGFKYIQSASGINEYRLEKNGLRVLLLEDHSSPTATLMLTYHVGSRNEVTGQTGATHLLEHLMFKGSKRFHRQATKHIWWLEEVGAVLNATTSKDRTNYFETVPMGYLEDAIAIEADRMRQALIRKEDLQTEMTVVRNEFERGQNFPLEALDLEIWAAAFLAHPYHHDTIGWRADIENVNVERLQDFYNTFYWPSNATTTVVGDIEVPKTLELIKKYFGRHQPCPTPLPKVYTQEPKQEGPRRVTVKRAGETGIVGLAFKIPEALHPDRPALEILVDVLVGGRSSRLSLALVDKGLASQVLGFAFPLSDPGLLVIYCFLTAGTPQSKVERLIWQAIKKIQKQGISEKELAKAKKVAEAAIAYSRDGSYAVASSLNEAIAAGDWTLYVRYPKEISRVKKEEVKKAAETYLIEDQSTTGWFIPKKNA